MLKLAATPATMAAPNGISSSSSSSSISSQSSIRDGRCAGQCFFLCLCFTTTVFLHSSNPHRLGEREPRRRDRALPNGATERRDHRPPPRDRTKVHASCSVFLSLSQVQNFISRVFASHRAKLAGCTGDSVIRLLFQVFLLTMSLGHPQQHEPPHLDN